MILVEVFEGKDVVVRELHVPPREISETRESQVGDARVLWLTASNVHYQPLFKRTSHQR